MRVPVASTRKLRFDAVYSVLEIPTVSAAGVTVNVTDCEMPFKDAPTVALNEDETEVVLTVKFALVAPAGTVTLAGTVTIGELELVKVTVVGDVAAALKVTVPCDALPPATLAGFMVKLVSDGAVVEGAVTVKIALCDELP